MYNYVNIVFSYSYSKHSSNCNLYKKAVVLEKITIKANQPFIAILPISLTNLQNSIIEIDDPKNMKNNVNFVHITIFLNSRYAQHSCQCLHLLMFFVCAGLRGLLLSSMRNILVNASFVNVVFLVKVCAVQRVNVFSC